MLFDDFSEAVEIAVITYVDIADFLVFTIHARTKGIFATPVAAKLRLSRRLHRLPREQLCLVEDVLAFEIFIRAYVVCRLNHGRPPLSRDSQSRTLT